MSSAPPPNEPDRDPFSDEPPPSQRRKSYVEIVRPGPHNRFAVSGYLVSPKPVGLMVHWAGRNVICTKSSGWCQLCEAKVGARWYGYLAAVARSSTKLFLLEISPTVFATVKEFIASHQTLRGCFVTLSRPSEKINGRLSIDIKPSIPADPASFPAVPDLRSILGRIYQLTSTEEESQGDD